MTDWTLPSPDLQINFAAKLREIRPAFLQEALLETASSLPIRTIDADLATLVPDGDLRALAGKGLRGELVFAVPAILSANPRLLAYYRLLLGYSQKEFYGATGGAARYKSMEERGQLGKLTPSELVTLCTALCRAASALMAGLGVVQMSQQLLDDLTLLTLGPQFRGGANNHRGAAGIRDVFNLLHALLAHAIEEAYPTTLVVRNSAEKRVLIELAADPDIVFREEMSEKHLRNILAIEIKAGTDGSNIHNRLGEAEKSHQKAREAGFVECWTIVNVSRLAPQKARIESPSTNRFYAIASLTSKSGEEFDDFRRRVLSAAGVADPKAPVVKRARRKGKTQP